MSKVPADLKFAKTHEWIRCADGIATVGISDHAQCELTDIVFVELPAPGRELKAGEACAVVESVKTASDVYAPLTGTVTEVNSKIVANPALVNSDPYGEGWFYKMRTTHPTETEALLSPDAYARQINPA